MFPLEFRGEINHEETRVMGLLSGESCMILTSTVFDWSTSVSVTDGQTDRRTGDSICVMRAIAYNAVARKNRSLSASSAIYCYVYLCLPELCYVWVAVCQAFAKRIYNDDIMNIRLRVNLNSIVGVDAFARINQSVNNADD